MTMTTTEGPPVTASVAPAPSRLTAALARGRAGVTAVVMVLVVLGAVEGPVAGVLGAASIGGMIALGAVWARGRGAFVGDGRSDAALGGDTVAGIALGAVAAAVATVAADPAGVEIRAALVWLVLGLTVAVVARNPAASGDTGSGSVARSSTRVWLLGVPMVTMVVTVVALLVDALTDRGVRPMVEVALALPVAAVLFVAGRAVGFHRLVSVRAPVIAAQAGIVGALVVMIDRVDGLGSTASVLRIEMIAAAAALSWFAVDRIGRRTQRWTLDLAVVAGAVLAPAAAGATLVATAGVAAFALLLAPRVERLRRNRTQSADMRRPRRADTMPGGSDTDALAAGVATDHHGDSVSTGTVASPGEPTAVDRSGGSGDLADVDAHVGPVPRRGSGDDRQRTDLDQRVPADALDAAGEEPGAAGARDGSSDEVDHGLAAVGTAGAGDGAGGSSGEHERRGGGDATIRPEFDASHAPTRASTPPTRLRWDRVAAADEPAPSPAPPASIDLWAALGLERDDVGATDGETPEPADESPRDAADDVLARLARRLGEVQTSRARRDDGPPDTTTEGTS